MNNSKPRMIKIMYVGKEKKNKQVVVTAKILKKKKEKASYFFALSVVINIGKGKKYLYYA